MRKHAVWLVTLPVALVGIEAAHALANAAFGAPGSEVLESAESGAGLIPLLAALALAAVLCGLVGRVAGLWWTPRRSRAVLLPFVLLPPLGFVLLELGEALAHSPIEWEELVGPTFLVGLALQLPVALVGYLLARALLRLSDEVRELRPTGSPPPGARHRVLVRHVSGRRPAARDARLLGRPRAGTAADGNRLELTRSLSVTAARAWSRQRQRGRNEMTDKQSRVQRALPSSRRGRTGVVIIAVLCVAAVLGVALALATVFGGGGTGQAASTMSMAGMNMGPSEGTAYWHRVGGAGFKSDGKVAHLLHQRRQGRLGLRAARPQRDHRRAVRRGRRHLRQVGPRPDRLALPEVPLPRLHGRHASRTCSRRPADERYLGLLGPVIRAEVGDTIKVVFRNTCPFPASVHPHGVFYEKDSEGAPYNDGTSGADKADDAVPTGGRHTYVWQVPERAGPAPGDGSSVMWMYHSHTDEVADTYAGLMGPMEITARGMARPDGSPKDVDREFFALFSVMNENESPYLEQNLHRFAEPPFPDLDDEDFEESNLMHSINGYVFGNQPLITMHKGERVRWYVMSMGTEVDLHTPHWHGNTVTVNGMRMDTVSLLPATMIVADMVPDDPGIWLFHCHVNDHIRAGMLTRYRVVD